MTLYELAKQKIIVLDGAMGTMIQRHKLSEEDFRGERYKNHSTSLKGNNDILSITQAEIIKDIHLQYLEAGSDIIETNTFNSQSISMADYQCESEVYDINVAAVKCAILAREEYYSRNGNSQPKFIAGAIGPTNRTASLSPDVNDPGFRNISFEELVNAYSEQVTALIDGGVDILLVETIFDTLNAKAAFFAILEIFEQKNIQLPLMASGTITDASGRTLSGQTAEAFAVSLSHIPLFSLGFNCALGASQLEPYLSVVSSILECAISAYPNAGLPNEMGAYDETPDKMLLQIENYFKKNLVNVIGGCCGTTPDHIRLISQTAQKYSPRNFTIKEHLNA